MAHFTGKKNGEGPAENLVTKGTVPSLTKSLLMVGHADCFGHKIGGSNPKIGLKSFFEVVPFMIPQSCFRSG